MPKLTKGQLDKLIGLVSSAETDELSCDDCLRRIGEFAEASLEERELSDGLQAIQRHLEQCVCCKVEYEALLDALKKIKPDQ